MANILNELSELLAQRRENAAFKVGVRGLDVSGLDQPIPADINPAMDKYLQQLRNVRSVATDVVDYPEEVFLGTLSGPRPGHLETMSESDKLPPRYRYCVDLGDVETPDMNATIGHLAMIIAGVCEIPDTQKAELVESARQSVKTRTWGNRSEDVDINSDWMLGFQLFHQQSKICWMKPSLVPVEKPIYSEHWQADCLRLLGQAVQLENVTGKLAAAAEVNFLMRRTPVAEIDVFNVGGDPGRIITEVENQGWGERTKGEDEVTGGIDYTYRHESGNDIAPHLGVKTHRHLHIGEVITVSALASPGWQAERRKEFNDEFRRNTEGVVENLREKAAQVEDPVALVNLSPNRLAELALKRMGQRLDSADYATEIPGLSEQVMGILGQQFGENPDLGMVIQRLSDAKDIDLELTIISGRLPAGGNVDSGRRPEEVELIVPAGWLTKANKA